MTTATHIIVDEEFNRRLANYIYARDYFQSLDSVSGPIDEIRIAMRLYDNACVELASWTAIKAVNVEQVNG